MTGSFAETQPCREPFQVGARFVLRVVSTNLGFWLHTVLRNEFPH